MENNNGNCITLQKNVTLYYVEGSSSSGNNPNPTYFNYPTLPNGKSSYHLYGNFWSFKYFFEAQSQSQQTGATALAGAKVESDACQMYVYLTKSSSDSSDVDFQLYCDSGPKMNFGGWQLAKMKWVSVKVAYVSPDSKQIVTSKSMEGETRCAKLLCKCGQAKVCLRKQSFCSSDYLQPFFVINKCLKPKNGMAASFYCTMDVLVTLTLYPHNPKCVPSAFTNGYDLYWKSQHEASKRIFHSKIGTDFKLEVGGKEFPCHKCILAGHSEVFARMFANDNGKRAALPSRLVMENMSAVAVDSFLKYLYYGDTAFSGFPVRAVYELMSAAEKYQIPHLRRTSYEILLSKPVEEFDCGTALKMYLHCSPPTMPAFVGYSSAPLKRIALQSFAKSYAEFVKSQEFAKLFAENRECAQELLISIHKNK